MITLPFDTPHATLANTGGKGMNLARLAQAGFPVPGGFLVTTDAYRQFVTANHLDAWIFAEVSGIQPDDPPALQAASQAIREKFAGGEIPPALAEQVREAYAALGGIPVAVRSSATAEDLPDMSFAGQQDTFLNITDESALLKAVVHCWSSLWTARAIGYRARNSILHNEVALSVVVQEMVQAEASGVLFTANPLNGVRTETVIDATLGLGEALVAGLVEPDHYVVDTRSDKITRKSLGAKKIAIRSTAGGGVETVDTEAGEVQAVSDEQILALAALGQRVQAHYDFPQDLEWAVVSGELFLLQSRPITSLYPIPEELEHDPLKVLIGFHTVQGIMEPITPLGQDTLKVMLNGTGRVFGVKKTYETQMGVLSAGERLWINVTNIIRHPLGRKFYPIAIKAIDPGVAQAFWDLIEDPRLAPARARPSFAAVRRAARFAFSMLGRIRKCWRDPASERARIAHLLDTHVAKTQKKLAPTGDVWVDFAQRLTALHEASNIFGGVIIPHGVAAVVAGMVPFFGILQRFSKQAAAQNPAFQHLYLEIARGLPHNVTTEMDLILWETAQTLRADPDARRAFEQLPAPKLAADYLIGELPPAAQGAVAAFMQRYGMRGIGEIDMGRPRWREKPAHVMQVLQSYLKIEDGTQAPDAVFARGAAAAEVAGERLADAIRKTHGGRFKARLVRWAVGRYRALAGLRESPKFFAIRTLGLIRQGLLDSGQTFAEAGLLAQPEDVFFLRIRELEEILAAQAVSPELRARVAERRAVRAREMLRKQIPRVLLSDGRAIHEGVRAAAGDAADALVGDPVSPGMVEGVVRVVLDPYGAQLQPGEILVCPGTDPAWTPLFLAAGGLVMEVGGMMTHGSVVAREYGIPAVVGVHEATTRLKTGMRVRVDGSGGRVERIAD